MWRVLGRRSSRSLLFKGAGRRISSTSKKPSSRSGRSFATTKGAYTTTSWMDTGIGSGVHHDDGVEYDYRYLTDTPVTSTQDEMKRILREEVHHTCTPSLIRAVQARVQTHGRGTRGRQWHGGDRAGNVCLTLAVPPHRIPLPTLTLLPLKVGVVIAEAIDSFLQKHLTKTTPHMEEPQNPCRLQLKWPNDVLVNDRKLAGVLMELWYNNNSNHHQSANDAWILMGIGINVTHAPQLSSTERPALCLQEVLPELQLTATAAPELGRYITQLFHAWLHTARLSNTTQGDDRASTTDLEAQIVRDWKRWAYPFQNKHYVIRDTGEEVVVLDLLPAGQLKVRGADGTVRSLMADYLY